jgi:hypothetical protein
MEEPETIKKHEHDKSKQHRPISHNRPPAIQLGGVRTFVVTLTTFKDVRSCPCRSLESATKLAARFIAGVTRPARPSTPEAETNPHQYDGPPRMAEHAPA